MTTVPTSSWKIAQQLRAAYLFSVCALMLTLTPMLHAADSCGAIDSEKIEQKIALDLGFPPKTLFATRRTDLDDRLVDLQFTLWASGAGREAPGEQMPVIRVAVFDLSRHGYRLVDGRLADMVADLDDAPLWRVGYSCSTGTTYHLYGFEDSERGFNQLTSTLGLNVGSTDSALYALDSFVALTYRSGGVELIKGRLDLLKSALAQYDGKDDVDSFLASWRRISAAVGKKVTSPTAIASGDHFTLKCYVGTEEGIQRIVLSMGTDGHVSPQGKMAVYRWAIQKQ